VLVLQVRGPGQIAALQSLLGGTEPRLEICDVAVATRDRAVVELVRR
jgi:hypothetical protein